MATDPLVPTPQTGAPFFIDEKVFWEQVALFRDWDYQYKEQEPHRHAWNPDAKAGYAADLLRLAQPAGYNVTVGGPSDADKNSSSDVWKRRYTNCCMFVEAVVLGSVLASPRASEFKFVKDYHSMLMGYAGEGVPLPRKYPAMYAYVEAGVGTAVPDFRDGLEPDTIYAVMTHGHHVFIVDFAPDGRFLTIEANHDRASIARSPTGELSFARPLATWWGGVGYRGVGRMETAGTPWPRDWRARFHAADRWDKNVEGTINRDTVKAVVKLHIKKSAQLRLPFDAEPAPRPRASYFHLAEAGSKGGFFPLGADRNLHGGVHLPVEGTGLQPVYALGPGEVVAARLGQPTTREDGTPSSNKDALALADNHNGFVLVRHHVREGKADDAARPIRRVYALYMHLAPLDAGGKTPQWLERLEQQRRGALVRLDPPEALRRDWLHPGDQGNADEAVVYDGVDPATKAPVSAKVRLRDGERVLAVRRPAAADVDEALTKVRDDGAVATFAVPFLRVDSGDLLGHASPDPTGGRKGKDGAPLPGFLHLEVLAPVNGSTSDLEALLAHACAAVGGPVADVTTAFPRHQEETPDNLLSPAELQAVLARLPDPPAGPLKDGQLEQLLKETLLFSVAPSTAPEGEKGAPKDYPIALELESGVDGQAKVPAGTYQVAVKVDDQDHEALSLTFDDAKGRGVLRVPAGARRVSLHPGPELALEPLSLDVRPATRDQFAQVTAARWRRLLLRRPNEWTVEGLGATVKAHFGALPRPTLDRLARALAWWDHDEVPIVGAGDERTSLFSRDHLPPGGMVDSMNPITFAWLLDLLVARDAASLLPVTGPTIDAQGHAVSSCGWLSPRWAAAVAKGDASDGKAKLLARKGPRSFPLEGPWKDGAASIPVTCALWGEWTLEPAQGQAKGFAGEERPTLKTAVPALGEHPGPGPVWLPAAGRFVWSVDFAADRPEVAHAWLVVEVGQERRALQVDLVAPLPRAGLPGRKGDSIVSGTPEAAVSQDFTWADWLAAAPRKDRCVVSARLAAKVQALRGDGPRPALRKLTADGRSVELVFPVPGENGAKPSERVALVTVPEAPATAGPLQAEFRLDALAALLDGQDADVRFVEALLFDGPPEAEPTSRDPKAIEARLGAGLLRLALADRPRRAGPRRIGPLRVTLGVDAKGAEALRVDAALEPRELPDPGLWKQLGPKLSVDGGPPAGEPGKDGRLAATFRIAKEQRGRSVMARASFAVVAADVARPGLPAEVPFLLTPSVTLAPIAPSGELELQVGLQAWPAERELQVRAFDAADARKTDLLTGRRPAGAVRFDPPARQGSRPTTCTCPAGALVARVTLPPGRYVLEVGPPAGAAPVLGKTAAELTASAPATVGAEELAGGPR